MQSAIPTEVAVAAGTPGVEPWLAQLLRPDAFPHQVGSLRLVETAISWVILTGEFAYKIKKPLRTEFIDALTVERREFLCEQEVQLNRRFCPDLYLGVVTIARDARGIGFDRTGTILDHAVKMRQFDQSLELAHALTHSTVTVDDLARLGRELARQQWRSCAAPISDHYGSDSLVQSQIQANFAPLQAALRGDRAACEQLALLQKWTEGALALLRVWMNERRSRHVRDCHGDLHAGNIVCWQGRWQPFDCLEFDPSLRWIDVISDLAFLYMDLFARGRADLAAALLNSYLEESGDYEGLRLLPLYTVYRALVRAKVAALSQQTEPLRHYLQVAWMFTEAKQPTLLLMHGVTASGKSWLSAQLREQLGALRVRSDVERYRRRSADATGVALGSDAYSPDRLRTTYLRLRFCAACALSVGFTVIVDATFLDRRRRLEFEALANRRNCPMLIVSCEAPLAVLEQRLLERLAHGADPSEATMQVLRAQWEARKPFEAGEKSLVVTIDTSGPVAVGEVVRRIHEQAASARR